MKTSGQVYRADFRKLDLAVKALQIYALPQNRYFVYTVRMKNGTADEWETIVVSPRTRPDVQYQLLSESQWKHLHLAGSLKELAAVLEPIIQDMNERGW